ncbi:terminase TerL endonuclease subunit [Aminobacter sp. BE322]|uniref:terminase TerL endonuclease subunit n=1 Tax=unclassified Aminobacter TaxID=2644704 RepID=UPI003D21C646
MIVIKAAEADTITGSKATFILIDETHVFASKAKAADIFVEIRGSLAARPDGFLIQITTQSKAPPAGVFKAELDIAREVRDGLLALPLLPILYELPPELSKNGGWRNRETWGMVNPNLNRSVDEAFLVDEITKAEREGKAQLALIASQHFNVQIGMGNFGDRWRGADYWEAAAFHEIRDLRRLLDLSEVVTVGVDMGGTDDLLGMAVVGREIGGKRWFLWSHAWAVPSVEEIRKSIAATLQDFVGDGTLTMLPTLAEVVISLADKVEEIFLSGKLPERAGIGFDAWGTKTVISELEMRGIRTQEHDGPIVGVSQGVRLSSAILTAEWRLREGTLVHGDTPMMNWCVGNAKAVLAGSNWKIEKAAAGTAKIDPLIAAFNAISLMDFNPQAHVLPTSPWDDPNFKYQAA